MNIITASAMIPTDISINKITRVEVHNDNSYSIDQDSGWSFHFSNEWGIVPHVGDNITLYTKNSEIIGVALNEVQVYLKTDEQLDKERKDWLKRYEKEKQESYEKNVKQMDEDYESLPLIFQKRIDMFRKNNKNFRKDYESYELFCCKEAVKIADTLKTKEAIKDFKQLSFEEQTIAVPTLDDGHSGNTFGCACLLASFYVSYPDYILLAHGALSPLVGSAEYGDIK